MNWNIADEYKHRCMKWLNWQNIAAHFRNVRVLLGRWLNGCKPVFVFGVVDDAGSFTCIQLFFYFKVSFLDLFAIKSFTIELHFPFRFKLCNLTGTARLNVGLWKHYDFVSRVLSFSFDFLFLRLGNFSLKTWISEGTSYFT